MLSSFCADFLPFSQTPFLPPLIQAYLRAASELAPYYIALPDKESIARQIQYKQAAYTQEQRNFLHRYLRELHQALPPSAAQQKNIDRIKDAHTFCICTAHQANLFSGPLYTIYKIIHTIKLCAHLGEVFSSYHFIPIFFLGSEDHDTEELNHIFLHQKKFHWEANSANAFGRRDIDTPLRQLVHQIVQELNAYPYAKEIKTLLENCYMASTKIETATIKFYQHFFAAYGVLFFTPDNAAVKEKCISFFEQDIFEHTTETAVNTSIHSLQDKGYKVQATPRPINVFYFHNGKRSKIVQKKNEYHILESNLVFTKDTLQKELYNHPEHFSPNVFLRGLLQEKLLPNLIYIGGSGEIAYWLELKNMFAQYNTLFPLLLVRHSFLFLDQTHLIEKINKEHFSLSDLLMDDTDYLKSYMPKSFPDIPTFIAEKNASLQAFYQSITQFLAEKKIPLSTHIQALQAMQTKKLQKLQQKIYRHLREQKHIHLSRRQAVRAALFPQGILQERYENILPYYGRYGKDFITLLLHHARTWDTGLLLLHP